MDDGRRRDDSNSPVQYNKADVIKPSLLWRYCVRVRASKSSGLRRLSMGFSLARCPVSDGTSLSAIRYTLDFPQSSLSSAGRSTASPTTESSTTVVQVHCGRGQQSSVFLLVPTSGIYPHSVPVSSVVYLTDPP